MFWKIDSSPLILTYPPRGISENFQLVWFLSLKVKRDLSQLLNKQIHVIYNPVKDVFYDSSIQKNNMFLYVGRAKDPIKRINIVHDSLLKIENGIRDIKICGSENQGFGNYLGVVSDEELNRLYNSTKYVYLPSKAEGIGLSMIEGMICGCIPITCSDNETAKEFSPADFICDPDPQAIVKKINSLDKDYAEKRKKAIQEATKYAILIPYKVMETSYESMEIMKVMANIGNPNSITDVGVALYLLYAAAKGASMNVIINANEDILSGPIGYCSKNEF